MNVGERPKIDKPHDGLVKAIFSKVGYAAELFRTGLPAELVSHVAFESLASRTASFVDDWLRESASDLLFAGSCGSQEILLLLEHLSTVQHHAIVRLWCYAGAAWQDHLAKSSTARSVPVVIPYVLHHSSKGWTAPTSIRAFIEHESAAHASLNSFVPVFECVVDDLTSQTDGELLDRDMSAVPKLTLWALKVARDDDALRATIGNWTEIFRQALDTRDELLLILRYILEVSSVEADGIRTFLVRDVGRNAEELYMTAAEVLRNEGRDEGRRETSRTMLLTLLQERFDDLSPETTARIGQASAEQVVEWFKRALTAKKLTEVFTDA